MNKHLIIIAKNLRLGKVKTRLAATIGEEAALNVYTHLLNHTLMVAIKTNTKLHVFWDYSTVEDKLEVSNDVIEDIQVNGDLGKRMVSAISSIPQPAAVVVIGADCYQLESSHILKAFNVLENHELCIGPADDGGYYLIGMSPKACKNKKWESIFQDIDWSTDKVKQQTLAKAEQLSFMVDTIDILSDVDVEMDLIAQQIPY